MNHHDLCVSDLWLSRYAKLVVVATFIVIMIGGHTTTSGAGMAFPDWPLSHGSLNPDQWWTDFMQRLEHGHRMAAESVALLIGILCAWVWQSKWSLLMAFAGSAILAVAARLADAPPPVIAHVGLWSAAAIFAFMILFRTPSSRARLAVTRWIAFAAFAGVCAQAILGGLRVTLETAGDSTAAITFRILHGCFAQLELCLVVVLATRLSPSWINGERSAVFPAHLKAFAWSTAALVYLQLVIGAALRHNGAGLAIPTFPRAGTEGSWLPTVHSALIDLNFAHTRIGALVVSAAVLLLAGHALRTAWRNGFIIGPALLLLFGLALQVVLGMFVIWQSRRPIVTTAHVLNGAAVLAATVLLAMRLSRNSSRVRGGETFAHQLEEAHA
ncbi:MAG TPA: COX15/CtaA family protein [Chthoniobacteraceae bacterium]|nr:COX15/CtaA family protein [Chthoniobacteraceae bacterium]